MKRKVCTLLITIVWMCLFSYAAKGRFCQTEVGTTDFNDRQLKELLKKESRQTTLRMGRIWTEKDRSLWESQILHVTTQISKTNWNVWQYDSRVSQLEAECARYDAVVRTMREGFVLPRIDKEERVLGHRAYWTVFDARRCQAKWVAYMLTRAEINHPVTKRDGMTWRKDPQEKSSLRGTELKGTGFQRGHIIPAADVKWDLGAMTESFYTTNMMPQQREMNRDVWEGVERMPRKLVKGFCDSIYIVSGPMWAKNPRRVGRMGVPIPSGYWRVMLRRECRRRFDVDGNGWEGIAFFVPIEAVAKELTLYAMNINQLEKLTGIDFFPLLPDQIEEEVEKEWNRAAWQMS